MSLRRRRHEAYVHAPRHAGQAADQIPGLHALDEGKVDDADEGPKDPAGADEGPELGAAPAQHDGPVDGAVAHRVGREEEERPRLRGVVRHGRLQAPEHHAERERVERRADRLVQQRLGQRVGDVELGLYQRARGLLLLERRLVVGSRRGDGRGGGDDLRGGGEGGLEEFLPGMMSACER